MSSPSFNISWTSIFSKSQSAAKWAPSWPTDTRIMGFIASYDSTLDITHILWVINYDSWIMQIMHEFGTYVNSSTQPDSNIFPSLSIVVDALFPSFILFFNSLSKPQTVYRWPHPWSFLITYYFESVQEPFLIPQWNSNISISSCHCLLCCVNYNSLKIFSSDSSENIEKY